MSKLEFALIYPNAGEYVSWEHARSTAVAAEENNFSYFLVWDHYMLPYSARTFEAWTLLSAISNATSSIKLGTCVTPLPFRHPAQLAKIVATLDYISGGRVVLGVGAGWYKPEFDAYSKWAASNERVSMVEESLSIMLRLWKHGRIDLFEGRYYKVIGAELEPKPAKLPKLFFGAFGPRMMRLTARFGDAWIPTKITPEEYGRGLTKIRRLASREGRDPGSVLGALQIYDPPQTVSEAISVIEAYADAGCQICGIVWRYPRSKATELIRVFAKEVMPSFV